MTEQPETFASSSVMWNLSAEQARRYTVAINSYDRLVAIEKAAGALLDRFAIERARLHLPPNGSASVEEAALRAALEGASE